MTEAAKGRLGRIALSSILLAIAATNDFLHSTTFAALPNIAEPFHGQGSATDKLSPKVLALVNQGESYRTIARRLDLNKNTVMGIVKRSRTAA